MLMRHLSRLTLLLVLTLGLPAAAAWAAEETRPIIFPTPSGASWPLWIAKEGGYFAKYDIDPEVTFGRHPTGVAAVSSGDALLTNTGLDSGIAAATKGDSLVLVGSPLNLGSFVLLGGKDIKDVKELEGKRIAVGRVGDPPYFYTIALLNAVGVDPDTIQWIPAGAPQARVVTVRNGGADASLVTPPSYYRLVEEGFPVLARMDEHRDIFIATGYLFSRDTLDNKPQVVENTIRALTEATKRFYDDKAFAIEAMKKYTPFDNDDDLARIYDEVVNVQQLERVPYILKQAIVDVAGRSEERLPSFDEFDYSRIIYNDVIDKLADEGFFEEVFGPSIRDEVEKKRALAFR